MEETIKVDLKKFWSEKLAHWQMSGKNGAQWCREQGLSYKHFNHWKKALMVEGDPQKIAEQFTELTDEPLEESTGSGIKLQCKGFLLHVDVDFDGETLRRLILLIMRAFPC